VEEIVAAPVLKSENTAVGIRSADHAAPSIRKKLALTSPINGCRSISIVRSPTKATELLLSVYYRRPDQAVEACRVVRC
jgi:hypothetical protein